MEALVFGEVKSDCSWGSGGAVSPPRGLGRCLGEGVGAKSPNNFGFFFSYKAR